MKPAAKTAIRFLLVCTVCIGVAVIIVWIIEKF
jgi:hypothetical protein